MRFLDNAAVQAQFNCHSEIFRKVSDFRVTLKNGFGTVFVICFISQ